MTHGDKGGFMRIEIKTERKVRDNDMKAIYLMREAMRISSPHMRIANAQFALYPYINGVDYLRQKVKEER